MVNKVAIYKELLDICGEMRWCLVDKGGVHPGHFCLTIESNIFLV